MPFCHPASIHANFFVSCQICFISISLQVESEGGPDANVDDWHRDSYPFVCVVMLSDPTGMTGGETMCKKADGSCLPICFPAAGSAIVLQVPAASNMTLPFQACLGRLQALHGHMHAS